jgi:hypothetical protein
VGEADHELLLGDGLGLEGEGADGDAALLLRAGVTHRRAHDLHELGQVRGRRPLALCAGGGGRAGLAPAAIALDDGGHVPAQRDLGAHGGAGGGADDEVRRRPVHAGAGEACGQP